MRRNRIIRSVVPAFAAIVLLAACSKGGDDPVASADEGPRDKTPTTVAADDTVVAIASTDLGQVLVDGEGFTIYTFLNDGPNASNCNDQCAQNWPPLTIDGSLRAGEGLTAAFGTITRADGSVQVTVDGRPLYRFANDQAPGDTNGQGVNGKWFVVDTGGSLVQTGV